MIYKDKNISICLKAYSVIYKNDSLFPCDQKIPAVEVPTVNLNLFFYFASFKRKISWLGRMQLFDNG